MRKAFTALATAALLLAGSGPAYGQASPRTDDPVLGAYRATVVAVGDIACKPDRAVTEATCQHAATARLVESLAPDRVLVLGDTQYWDGAPEEFALSYDPTWGRFRDITLPAVGNHEYRTPGAAGYYGYFGAAAGAPDRGYYAAALGGWRLLSLNSMCEEIGGCEAGSPQQRWLAGELRRHPARCTIAFWHHPRYTSTLRATTDVAPLWKTLQRFGAELALSGHAHDYERFAPMDSDNRVDYSGGVRSFVVGTGGEDLLDVKAVRPARGSQRLLARFGVLELRLYARGYRWAFHALGRGVLDRGSARCHGLPPSQAREDAASRP